MSTTTKAIFTLMESMNAKVPRMVMTPVKSWEKPWSIPSEITSMSDTTRVMRSPWEWPSM